MSKFLTWALATLLQPYARLDYVRLWETPTGYAECDYYDIFSDEEIESYRQVTFIDNDNYITLGEIIDAK